MKQTALFTLLLFAAVFCSAQITFQKVFNNGDTQVGYSVQQTADNGYIVFGSRSTGSADDLYLVKTNSYGDTLWTKTIGGTDRDLARCVIECSDGGFILTGTTYSFNAVQSDAFLIKTDANGNVLWSKMYGDVSYQDGLSVIETVDGGFLICGDAQANADYNFYLIKTDDTGNQQWAKMIGGGNREMGYSVRATSDGGFILAGSRVVVAAYDDACLIKINSNGNLQWIKTYGTPYYDEAFAALQTYDGGYILAGSSNTSIAAVGPGSDFFLVKTDAAGNLLWSKKLGLDGIDVAYALEQTTDSGFVMCGYSENFTATEWDAYVVKTDAGGNPEWSKNYGAAGQLNLEVARSIKETNDGGFVIAGNTGMGGIGGGIYLIKTDANGNSGCNETTPLTVQSVPVLQVGTPVGHVSVFGNQTNVTALVHGGGLTATLCSSCNPCPVPVSLSATNVTASAAKLNWNTTPCAIGYKLRYRPVNSSTWMNKTVNGNTGSKNIFSLTSNTFYEWQVRTRCSNGAAGLSAWSALTNFTTAMRLSDDDDAATTVTVFPNPATQSVEVDISADGSFDFVLFNVFGQQVVRAENISDHYILERNNLAAGVYLYRINRGATIIATGKIIWE